MVREITRNIRAQISLTITSGFCGIQDLIEEAIQRLYVACTNANAFPGTQPVVQGGRVTIDSILVGLGLDMNEHRYTTQSSLCPRRATCQKNQHFLVFEEDMGEELLRSPTAIVKVDPHTTTALHAPSPYIPSPTKFSSPSDYAPFGGSEILSDGSSTHTAGPNSVFSSPTENDKQVDWRNVETQHTKPWLNELHQYRAPPVNMHDALHQTHMLPGHIASRNFEADQRLAGHIQHFQIPLHYQANQTYHYQNVYMPPNTVQYNIEPPAMFTAPIAYLHGAYTNCYQNTITTTKTEI